MPMDLDYSSVNHRDLHVGLYCQSLINALKSPCHAAVPNPAVNRVPFAELTGKVAPLRPSSGDPEHALEKQTGVIAHLARIKRLAKTVQFDLRPLAIRDDVAVNRPFDCGLWSSLFLCPCRGHCPFRGHGLMLMFGSGASTCATTVQGASAD